MIFYLHYILMTSGLSGISVLLAVYFREYSDASQSEIGTLLMSFPFVGLIIKPLFCSLADRHQSHKLYFVLALIVELAGYSVFAIVPLFPSFYLGHPRWSWWVLVVACHVGNGGLGVAWSLGDCLAMNMSQKTGVPFGRMRLMGTVSWGVYGFIIGQINELPALPKYLPAFIILIFSLIVEIVLVVCWNNEDFVMVDPLAGKQQSTDVSQADSSPQQKLHHQQQEQLYNHLAQSTPSSLGGTLRLNANTAHAFKEVFATPEDLNNKLRNLEEQREPTCKTNEPTASANNKNPQFALLKMILVEDGRLIKYICLFTVFGLYMAPMNFLFLSMEEVCQKRGFNFSQLAGAVLISQAAIETVGFLVVPMMLNYVTRSISMSLTFLLMGLRFVFYAGWYYDGSISPYWAVLGEWAHGIGYGIFCTVQADVALMFANQSRLFIDELRRLGYLSQVTADTPREQIEQEERGIKMALRATMQAIFDGFMSGMGMGAGSLLCGIFIELYDYIKLWQFYYWIAFGSIVLHQLIEMTRSKWSDTYRPRQGTKADEIMQLNGGGKGRGSSQTNQTKTGVVCQCHDNNNSCASQQVDQKLPAGAASDHDKQVAA